MSWGPRPAGCMAMFVSFLLPENGMCWTGFTKARTFFYVVSPILLRPYYSCAFQLLCVDQSPVDHGLAIALDPKINARETLSSRSDLNRKLEVNRKKLGV